MWSYTRSCPHAREQCSALRGSGAWQGGTEGWWGWGAHLACAPSGSGSAEARPPFHSAAGRQTRCRLSSPEAQAPRAHSPLGSCPRAGAGKSAEEAGHDGVTHRSLTWPPAPTAPAKAVEGLGGCELLEGRCGEPPLRAQRPHPTSNPGCRWVCSPAVPGRTQRSGSLGTRRIPAGGCRVAPPGCGSALGCPLQMMSRLHSENGVLRKPSSQAEDPGWSPCPFPAYVLVSLQMGRYSSC